MKILLTVISIVALGTANYIMGGLSYLTFIPGTLIAAIICKVYAGQAGYSAPFVVGMISVITGSLINFLQVPDFLLPITEDMRSWGWALIVNWYGLIGILYIMNSSKIKRNVFLCILYALSMPWIILEDGLQNHFK